MLFFYEKMSTAVKMGVFSDTNPFVATYAITPNEISFTGCYADIAAVSAGINPGNPATFTLEFSRDGGTVWNAITGVTADPITGVAQFLVEAGGQVLVGPLMRLTITPPAGESLRISEVGIRRIRPGMVATLLSYGAGGGGLGDVGVFYQRGPGGAFANTKPAYDTTTPANNRPWPVTLVPDSGNPSSGVSSTAGVLTAPSPMYGFAGFQALTAWDVSSAARAEISGSVFEKAAPGDSQAIDSMSWAYNLSLTAWVMPVVDALSDVAAYAQTAPVASASFTLATLNLWDGTSRQEIVAENVAVATQHVLTATPTKGLPTVAVLMGWDSTGTQHLEAEIVSIPAAAGYSNAGPIKVLATSPMIGFDADSSTHDEVVLNSYGNVTTNVRWKRDAAEQEIVEDTANPAVNRPLPVQPMANNATAGGFTNLECTAARLLKVQESAEVGGTLYHSYLATPVDTVNWQQLSAGIGNDATKMEIFDSSGELLELGLGAAGAEVRHIFIMPGGNGANGNPTIVDIPTGTRISIRAVSATASDGFIAINWYYG